MAKYFQHDIGQTVTRTDHEIELESDSAKISPALQKNRSRKGTVNPRRL